MGNLQTNDGKSKTGKSPGKTKASKLNKKAASKERDKQSLYGIEELRKDELQLTSIVPTDETTLFEDADGDYHPGALTVYSGQQKGATSKGAQSNAQSEQQWDEASTSAGNNVATVPGTGAGVSRDTTSSGESVFCDPLTPVGFAAEHSNQCSEESIRIQNNITLNSFKLNEYEARINSEKCRLSKLGISKTSQINLYGPNSCADFASDDVLLYKCEDMPEHAAGSGDGVVYQAGAERDSEDSGNVTTERDFLNSDSVDQANTSFKVTRIKKIDLTPKKIITDSGISTSDNQSSQRRTVSVSDSASSDNLESNVLRKVASLTLDKSTLSKIKNVPEKLQFQIYDIFEGHMLVNWLLSTPTEDRNLKHIQGQDLRTLVSFICNQLLAAGVLRQIPDKDVEIQSYFRPDLMYCWTHNETPASVPATPGRLTQQSWPPMSLSTSDVFATPPQNRTTINNVTNSEHQKTLESFPLSFPKGSASTPIKNDFEKQINEEFKNGSISTSALKDARRILELEEVIVHLRQELEKYKTMADIHSLTENTFKDFGQPEYGSKDKVNDVQIQNTSTQTDLGESIMIENIEKRTFKDQATSPVIITPSISSVAVGTSPLGCHSTASQTFGPIMADSEMQTISTSPISPTKAQSCSSLVNNKSLPSPNLTEGPPPPPPISGLIGGPPPPPPISGLIGGPPPPPPISGLIGGPPPPPPMFGLTGGPPPPPPMAGLTGGPPPPPPMSGLTGGPPPPPPMSGLTGGPPPPPPMSGLTGGPPPPPPISGLTGGPPPPPPMIPGTAMGSPWPPPMAGPVPPPIPGFAGAPSPFPMSPAGGWNANKAMTEPGHTTTALRKNPRKPAVPMRPLYWTRIVIPINQKVETDTVWNKIEETALPNITALEDLFSRQVKATPVKKKKVEKPSKVQPAKLLDSKRSQNVGILSQSLHAQFSEIENAIYNFDTSVVSLEALQHIYEARATEEELSVIKNHIESNTEVPLDKPEQFLYDLSEISHFADRITCFMFITEFEDGISAIDSKLDNIKSTCDFLIKSEELRSILKIILTVGNHMNGGNVTRGQADGFGLDILAKLKDVKSKDSSVTLLHFIIRTYIEKNEFNGQVPTILPIPEPGEIDRASNVNFEEVYNDLKKYEKELNRCENRTKKVIAGSDEANLQPFKDKLTSFLESARKRVDSEIQNLNTSKQSFIQTMITYGFKPKTGTLEDCQPQEFFILWSSFCFDFKDIWKKERQKMIEARMKLMKNKNKKCEVRPIQPGGLKWRMKQKYNL